MTTATQDTYESILSMYTPLDIKDIITNGASRKAIHHRDKDDILSWYATYNEGMHHNLLDSDESVMNQYLFMQKCYNLSERGQDDQYYFIRDIVWLYIDGICNDLGEEYQLNTKTRDEIQDEMLKIDLEHRKAQLHVIDGGKK